MLQKNRKVKVAGKGYRVAIVASEYNARYVNGMLKAAESYLNEQGAAVTVVRVPGAFEIPVIAAHFAQDREVDAVICLGLILEGVTAHADHIGKAVTDALVLLQINHLKPVIHEVLVVKELEHAKVRCLSPDHNKGTEAAQAALKMCRVMKKLLPDVPF
ncbi:MAG: 6,7-dimethyl-8-ribityllumazine synthase [Verrucomicrobia bacterium]|jgi:6,7-dimethyl-8-ribityllumazine synthase|nr:6,7-dimethyl-8-ribityllumazine synthase [Verrucomicrobiota bacterium]